ncbi:MAG: HNH endonuclease [Candidatus Omnitrophica bacterium]|nr:HNH endonuclease [Candidatus Omnitrophota bacterium]
MKSGNYYCFFWSEGRDVRLHRFLTNCPDGFVVDHKDRNTLNNRQSNLRVCTQRENTFNSIGVNKTSKFKGVHKCINDKYKSKYFVAKIRINSKKEKILGYYTNEHNAALAYNIAAKEYFGEFAFLNDGLDRVNPEDEIIYLSGEDNSRKNKKIKDSYRGVTLHNKTGKYRARLTIKKKEICLGYFMTPEEAAMAYNEAVLKNKKNITSRIKLNRIEEKSL